MKKKFIYFYALAILGLVSIYANNVVQLGRGVIPDWMYSVFKTEKTEEVDITPQNIEYSRNYTRTIIGNRAYAPSSWNVLPNVEGNEEVKQVSANLGYLVDLSALGTNINEGDTMQIPLNAGSPFKANTRFDILFGDFPGGGTYGTPVGEGVVGEGSITITFNRDAKRIAGVVIDRDKDKLGMAMRIPATFDINLGQKLEFTHLDGQKQAWNYPDNRPVVLSKDEMLFRDLGIVKTGESSRYSPENFSVVPVEGSTDNGPAIFELATTFDFSRISPSNIKSNASVVFPVSAPLIVENQEITDRYGKFVLNAENNTITFTFSERGAELIKAEGFSTYMRIPVRLAPISDYETKEFTHLDGVTKQSILYTNSSPKDISSQIKYENLRLDLGNKGGISTDKEITMAGLESSFSLPFDYLGRINFDALNYNFKAGDYFTFRIPDDVSVSAGTYSLGNPSYVGAEDIATLTIDPITKTGRVTLKEEATSIINTSRNQKASFFLNYKFPAEVRNLVNNTSKNIIHPDGTTSQKVSYVQGKRKIEADFSNFSAIAQFGTYPYPKPFGITSSGNSDPTISYLYAGDFDISKLKQSLSVGDYFEINVPAPLTVEATSALITGAGGNLKIVLQTDVDNAKAAFTVVQIPQNSDALNGNYRIPVKVSFDPNLANIKQEKEVPSPDGKSIQKVSWTYNPPPVLRGQEWLSKAYYIDQDDVDLISWVVFVNRNKDNLTGRTVKVIDEISSNKGTNIDYISNSFEVAKIAYRNEENLNDRAYRSINRILVTQDENLFRTENAKKANSYALLKFTNGGKGFEIDLGNQLGADPYALIYKTTSPRDGSFVSNKARLFFDNQPVKPSILEDKEEEPEGYEVTTKVFSPPRSGGDGAANSRPQIRIIKTDEMDASKKLQGAVFDIKQKDVIVETITTDENGEALSSALDEGKYQIVEKTAPDGYILDTTERRVEIFNGQGLVSVEITNARIPYTDADLHNPIGQIVDTPLGDLPIPNGSIFNTVDLPADVVYAWGQAPDVSSVGIKEAVVKITYPKDNSEVLVPVKVNVYSFPELLPVRKEVEPTGLVGVNTDTPQAMLDIRYVSNVEGTDKVFELRNSAGLRLLTLTKEGLLGLNKEVPSAKLHIRQANNNVNLDASILSFQNVSGLSRANSSLSGLLKFVDEQGNVYGGLATNIGEMGIVAHRDKGISAVLRTDAGVFGMGDYSQIITKGSGVNRIIFEIKTGNSLYKTIVQHTNHWRLGGDNVIENEEIRERVVVEGAVRVGGTGAEKRGTIIYKDGHLQVYNGTNWVQINND